MKKKILALFLCLSLLIVPFGTISVSAETAETPKTYVVATADQLIDAIDEINDDGGDKSANITLKANINLTDKEFTPLATYSGTFDGGDYTITGLSIINTSASDMGLIANGSGCTVQNLVIDDATVAGKEVSAILIARINTAGTVTVSNVTIKNSIVYTSSGASVGAFLGQAQSSADVVVNVKNSTLENTMVIGAGGNQAGGFIGAQTNGSFSFENCKVIDSYVATTNTKQQVGAFVGRAAVNAAVECTFTKCSVSLNPAVKLSRTYKNASDEDTTYTQSPAVYSSQHHAGGFVGYAKSPLTFTDCTFVGTVTAELKNAGGFVGSVDQANIKMTATRCAVNATVTSASASGASTGVAGFVGYFKNSGGVFEATDCIVVGNISEFNQGVAGGFVGYTNGTVTLNDSISVATISAVSETTDAFAPNVVVAGENHITVTNELSKVDCLAQIDELFTGDFINVAKEVAFKNILNLYGYQTQNTAPTGNPATYDIRFVAYIDSASYAEAGMKFQVGEKTFEFKASNLYKALYAKVGTTDKANAITIETLGNYETGYILAIKVTGVPVDVTTFTVTPYVKTAADGPAIYGATVADIAVKLA